MTAERQLIRRILRELGWSDTAEARAALREALRDMGRVVLVKVVGPRRAHGN